jgi:transcriptional regulator NrdR family protein
MVESATSPYREKGVVCVKCGCKHFNVVYTRRVHGNVIVRRRECRNCGQRLSTREVAV